MLRTPFYSNERERGSIVVVVVVVDVVLIAIKQEEEDDDVVDPAVASGAMLFVAKYNFVRASPDPLVRQ